MIEGLKHDKEGCSRYEPSVGESKSTLALALPTLLLAGCDGCSCWVDRPSAKPPTVCRRPELAEKVSKLGKVEAEDSSAYHSIHLLQLNSHEAERIMSVAGARVFYSLFTTCQGAFARLVIYFMSDDRLAKYLTLSHARSPKQHRSCLMTMIMIMIIVTVMMIITIIINMAHDSCRNKCLFKRGK